MTRYFSRAMFIAVTLVFCGETGAGAGIWVSPALAQQDGGGVVNVYSYRSRFLTKPVFDLFTAETGIRVRVVSAKEGLIERIAQEGENSPSDLLISNNATHLIQAKERNITAAVKDKNFVGNSLPRYLRDGGRHWFALTRRARILYVAEARLGEERIRRYEDLSLPQWKGRVCTRSFTHGYNMDLLAAMLVHNGSKKTRAWLTGLRDNLARKPQGNDRAQIRAVSEGICDVAIGNSYYFGIMQADPKQRIWTKGVTPVFPNQNDYGTHMNLTGMALVKTAPNRTEALQLMSFMLSFEGQSLFAQQNHEYPALDGVPPTELLQQWGVFKQDVANPARIAKRRREALEMVHATDFNR